MLPSPACLLGIPKFKDWRPGQEQVFRSALEWYNSMPESRFLGLAACTGSGKSVLAVLLAKMSGVRTCVLTATKGLQNQLLDDFGSAGMALVKGQNNFRCTLVPALRADEGPCHEGMSCPHVQSGGCSYREQLTAALDSSLVLTNDAYYLAQTQFSSGLGDFGLLIIDEAHLAFSALESFLAINLSRLEVESLGLSFLPDDKVTSVRATKEESAVLWECWRSWALQSRPVVVARVKSLESDIKDRRTEGIPVPGAMSRSFRMAKSTALRLESLASTTGDWVIQRTQHGFQFNPIWVKDHSAALFQTTPKVMLMSAILTSKTCDSLGIPPAPDRHWIEAPSYFPPQNTPIWHVPTTRVNYRTDDYGTAIWLARIDQILDRRLDRKGIIFTVSYKRRDLLLQRSRHAGIMVTHSTGNVTEVVRRFKEMAPPAVLVSPAVTSGWDFPGDCRFIIVGKIPYPDTSDPVMMARQAEDKDWSSFLAMETIIQETGRGTRSSEDRCEVLILDDSWKWYFPLYKKYAPKWFQDRVRGSLLSVPDPLV